MAQAEGHDPPRLIDEFVPAVVMPNRENGIADIRMRRFQITDPPTLPPFAGSKLFTETGPS